MRLVLRINSANKMHVNLSVWVNGGLATGTCGLTLRVSEVADFIVHTNPDKVSVDRENITEDVFRRVAGFKNVWFE